MLSGENFSEIFHQFNLLESLIKYNSWRVIMVLIATLDNKRNHEYQRLQFAGSIFLFWLCSIEHEICLVEQKHSTQNIPKYRYFMYNVC